MIRRGSKEFILLRYKEFRSSRYLGNLGDPPGGSSDKDELQTHAKMIRIQKYLETKAATTALNTLQQLFWLHLCRKDL